VKQSSVFKDMDCFVARGAPRNDDGLFWYVPSHLDGWVGWRACNDEERAFRREKHSKNFMAIPSSLEGDTNHHHVALIQGDYGVFAIIIG